MSFVRENAKSLKILEDGLMVGNVRNRLRPHGYERCPGAQIAEIRGKPFRSGGRETAAGGRSKCRARKGCLPRWGGGRIPALVIRPFRFKSCSPFRVRLCVRPVSRIARRARFPGEIPVYLPLAVSLALRAGNGRCRGGWLLNILKTEAGSISFPQAEARFAIKSSYLCSSGGLRCAPCAGNRAPCTDGMDALCGACAPCTESRKRRAGNGGPWARQAFPQAGNSNPQGARHGLCFRETKTEYKS